MIETGLDFSGLEGIAKDLEALSRAENNKVLRDATRAGAEVLKEEVIAVTSARVNAADMHAGGNFPAAAAFL
ncbi:hypothetical protein ACUODF_29900, partial [Escherichia coli]